MSEGLDTRVQRLQVEVPLLAQQITNHEQVCAERYANINESIGSIRSFLSKATLSIMGGMVLIIGFLIVDKFFK